MDFFVGVSLMSEDLLHLFARSYGMGKLMISGVHM